MQRVIKFIVITLVIIIVGLGITSLLLSKFIDPNQYKDRITTLINEKTGYQVALNGKIGWTLFPSLGINAENIDVKARTDAETPFMTVNQATISVKLLTLLNDPVFDAVSLDGLKMKLSVDQRGGNNWQSDPSSNNNKKINSTLPQAEVVNTLSSTEPKKPHADKSISIVKIHIRDASISYDNAQTQKNIQINKLSLSSNDISSTRVFPITIAFDIESTKPGINGHIDIASNALFNMENGIFDFSKIDIKGNLGGETFGDKMVPLLLAGNINVNTEQQKISLSQIIFGFSNLKMNTTIDYNMRNNEYKGDISILPFDLNTFRNSFTKKDDSTSSLPSRLALDATLAGNNQFVFLNNIKLLLNDIPFTARVGISSFDTKTIDITLNGDQIKIEALLAALGKEPRFDGILNFSTHLITNVEGDDITKNLNGTGQFEINNALLKGENLTQKLCDGIALLNQTSPTPSRGNDTHFDELKGSFVVENGEIRSNDLTAQMKGASAKAQAQSNIPNKTINANIGITVSGDSKDVACHVNEKYQNVALPIKCQGTYQTEPGKLCGVDKEGLANIAKGALIEKATEKLEKKYGSGIKGTLDKLFGK